MGSGNNPIGQIPIAGSVYGALTGSTSADAAAAAQTSAANSANATQQQQYNTDQANAAPYQAAGASGVSQLQAAMPGLTSQFTMQDFQQDPGYQFQLQQGQNAIQASAAAKGLLGSTGTMQNLNNYAQGMANTDYQQALTNFTNNQNQRYNMLSGLANMGQTANSQVAGAGQNYANQTGTNDAAIGNANSAASMQFYNGMMGLAKTGGQLAMMS